MGRSAVACPECYRFHPRAVVFAAETFRGAMGGVLRCRGLVLPSSRVDRYRGDFVCDLALCKQDESLAQRHVNV